ncbi:signal peptidase I [Chromatiales bacterium (ex Bugula neritina AB1)]|nr:signal peptidase I [Chromatiales bacterium (ex Bugula neritina AB1)]
MEIIPLIIFFSFRTFIAEPFHIPANSMYPTLKPGDDIVVYKLGYGNYDLFNFDILNTELYATVRRGDVIVFDFPANPGLSYIKRVIGLPGDQIKASDGDIFINDSKVPASVTKVENGITYLNESIDGNNYQIAHIHEHKARGSNFKVTVRPNSYFVLGDNRYNSNDSRYWGSVPEENLVGKLMFKFSSETESTEQD